MLQGKLGSWVEQETREPVTDRIYMLQVHRGGDLAFDSIGRGGLDLRRQNYTPEVLADFDHVTADLSSADPCGQLVLMTGPAGTGKTHLVRGIMHAVKTVKFVLLQAGDLRSFLSASPLGALNEFVSEGRRRRRRKGKTTREPIVLIIEDADACMLPRDGENMSQIRPFSTSPMAWWAASSTSAS